jgi:hypothetical protein
MARDWEAQFRTWSRPPSATETEKMERADKAVRDAIRKSAKLQSHDVHIHRQGSYYNRTNVPRESDVDIRVQVDDVFYPDWHFVDEDAWRDKSIRDRLEVEAGLHDGPYTYAEFKDDAGSALVDHFGPPPAVLRGDKAYDIHENTYRVDSDCLPAFRHVRYRRDYGGRIVVATEGIEFRTDKGEQIVNFPEQQHENGKAKHEATGQRFKKMVRVLKNLRNEMDEDGHKSAEPIASFLSECLVFNVPNSTFGHSTFYDEMREIIRYLYVNTEKEELCSEWGEESELLYLFKGKKAWTREQANAFLLAAWVYVGFQN